MLTQQRLSHQHYPWCLSWSAAVVMVSFLLAHCRGLVVSWHVCCHRPGSHLGHHWLTGLWCLFAKAVVLWPLVTNAGPAIYCILHPGDLSDLGSMSVLFCSDNREIYSHGHSKRQRLSLRLCFSVFYFYPDISSFTLGLSIITALNHF